MDSEIRGGPAEEFGAIPEVSEAEVAAPAEKAAHNPGVVAVVEMGRLVFLRVFADRALARLGGPYGVLEAGRRTSKTGAVVVGTAILAGPSDPPESGSP
jgi:hypothetical protein